MTTIETRLALKAAGFSPVPCLGKRPLLPDWPSHVNVADEEMRTWPDGNTGILTGDVSCFDADILHHEAAAAVEALLKTRLADRGVFLTRIGLPPKRAFLFRVKEPFKKIVVVLKHPEDTDPKLRHRLEVLGMGQQVVVDGVHPDTQKPYLWIDDKTPWGVGRDALPETSEEEMHALVTEVTELLCGSFGFVRDDGIVEFPDANKKRAREASARLADKYIAKDGSAPTDALLKSVAEALGKAAPDLSMLGEMSKAEYGRRRAEISTSTGISLKYLDMEYADRHKKTVAISRSAEKSHWTVELWPEPVDNDALLRDLTARIRRHVVMDGDSALASALWVMFAWVHNVAVHSPMLMARSPEAECGKSTLLGLISFLVPRGLVYIGGTPAVVYRMIEHYHPTLIVDEADDVFKDDPELRAVINSGWTRGAGVPRCNPETNEPEFFETFGPKALGMKGRRIPDTTLSRSIVIEMVRKLPGDKCTDFDHVDDAGLSDLRQRLARFAHDNAETIATHRPKQPEGFANRVAANWRTLLSIADLCGVGDEAREAAQAIARRDDEASLGVELLRDIKSVFEEKRVDRLSSANLVTLLGDMEDRPWAEMPTKAGRGKPITQPQLANFLRAFEVKPKTIRIGEITVKGYQLDWFGRAFRYIPLATSGENSRHTVTTAENSQKCRNITDPNVTAEMAENRQCYGVTGTFPLAPKKSAEHTPTVADTETQKPNGCGAGEGVCPACDGFGCPSCRPQNYGMKPRPAGGYGKGGMQ